MKPFQPSLEPSSQIEDFPVLGHERAVIRLNLSLTYQETGRHTEALTLLQESKEVFRAYGDTHLLVLAGFYEGILLQRLQRYREAREKYLLLIASASDIRKDSLAALHHAIGFCSIELGDFDDAEDNLRKAVSLHTQLGHTLEAMKGELIRPRQAIHPPRALRDGNRPPPPCAAPLPQALPRRRSRVVRARHGRGHATAMRVC